MKQQEVISVNIKSILTYTVLIGLFLFFIFKLITLSNEKRALSNPNASGEALPANTKSNFVGIKGKTLTYQDNMVLIDESEVSDGNLHAYNIFSETKGNNIYFFIVKASDGTYRAAANACEVCFNSMKGFRQVGDRILCENCRTTYSKDQIAMQKGGCNPRPIDRNVTVNDGRLEIDLADIERTADLF